MPRRNHVPKYNFHRASGQAYVKLPDGAGGYQFVYLGVHGSPESREAYRRKLAEHESRAANPRIDSSTDPSVAQIFVAFLNHAERHYRRADGTTTPELAEYKGLSMLVNGLYSRTRGTAFGPKALKAVRELMVQKDWCRKIINQRIGRLKHVFKWAVAEELVPPTVYQGLAAVEGLQRGRSQVRESEPVEPVDDAIVDATLPHLNRHVRGLVEFQRLTGCRPGEACAIRRSEIDTSGTIWFYRPIQHKGSWRGKTRVIAIGPRAQILLKGFFTPSIDDYLFSPRRAVLEIRAERARKRQTPCYPSHMKRNAEKRVKSPTRQPAERYNRTSYFNALIRACDRAFPPLGELVQRDDETAAGWWERLTPAERADVKAWRKAQHWHPNQLRHSHGTRVRKEFGLEAAQVSLGHAKADVTQIYAEKNQELAAVVAAKIG